MDSGIINHLLFVALSPIYPLTEELLGVKAIGTYELHHLIILLGEHLILYYTVSSAQSYFTKLLMCLIEWKSSIPPLPSLPSIRDTGIYSHA